MSATGFRVKISRYTHSVINNHSSIIVFNKKQLFLLSILLLTRNNLFTVGCHRNRQAHFTLLTSFSKRNFVIISLVIIIVIRNLQ